MIRGFTTHRTRRLWKPWDAVYRVAGTNPDGTTWCDVTPLGTAWTRDGARRIGATIARRVNLQMALHHATTAALRDVVS